MFELSIALKYLIPRWRQLSVSVISIISILVIALVVWLVVVFLSVTSGIEKNWLEKLVTLNSPMQVTPTQAYYQSYYYLSDSVSEASDYQHKSLEEKLHTTETNPYDPSVDYALPEHWPAPDGNKDPVKDLFAAINDIGPLRAGTSESAFAQLRLRLLRNHNNDAIPNLFPTQSFLSPQGSFLAVTSVDNANNRLEKALLPPSSEDLTNLLYLVGISAENIREDSPSGDNNFDSSSLHRRLAMFFDNAEVTALKTGKHGWRIPQNILPEQGQFEVCVIEGEDGEPWYIIVPETIKGIEPLQQTLTMAGRKARQATLKIIDNKLSIDGKTYLEIPLLLANDVVLNAKFHSFDQAQRISEIAFFIDTKLQGNNLRGQVEYADLQIGDAKVKNIFNGSPKHPPLWLYSIIDANGNHEIVLPSDSEVGTGILVTQRFRENEVLLGDRGYLSYTAPTASSVQEQRIPVYVAGFFDAGVLPVGSKLILVNRDIVSVIRYAMDDTQRQNGDIVNVWFKDINKAEIYKKQLIEQLKDKGIDKYWHVETFKEYDFAKNLVQQFQSDKNLLSLVAIVIIIVACSNIISMLIILVKDKKKEIGIILSMGASPLSVGMIFGLCGLVMGIAGSALGTLAAILTLDNLQILVNLIGSVQGYDMFNAAFYGDTLPNELSNNALAIVLIATIIISSIAGIIPAIKAAMMRPTTILRSE